MNEQLRRVWSWPLGLAVFTLTGLVSGLFFEGWGDACARAALAAPLAAIAWCCAFRRAA